MDMMNILKWLPDDDAGRMLDLERLFEMPGWKIVEEWAATSGESAQVRAANAGSWADNRIAYGQGLVYNEFLRLAERTLIEYTNMAEQAKLDSELEDEEGHE